MPVELARKAAYDYLIEKSGSTFHCINGRQRVIMSDPDAGAVINNAINRVPSQGWVSIKIKGGEIGEIFDIQTGIDFNNRHVFLKGAGIGRTLLKAKNSLNDHVINIAPTSNLTWSEVADLEIHGNSTNNTSGRGISLTTGGGGYQQDFHLRNVFIHYTEDECLYSERLWGHHITNCLFEQSNSANGGVHFNGNGSATMIGCRSSAHSAGYGIKCVSSKVRFQACEINSCYKSGLFLASPNCSFIGGYITDNNVAGTTYVGIKIGNAAANSIIQGVTLDGGSSEKYNVEVSANDCTFTGNCYKGAVTATINDTGARNLFDNLSNNAGAPGAAGDWATATREGVIVRDTANNKTYIYAGGGWREISAA